MFDLDTRLVVARVTYRLLRALKDPVAVEAAVREILPQLNSLAAKLEVISDIGYRQGVGHELVSESAAAELEKAWRAEVRSAGAEDLAKERDLNRVLLVAKRGADPLEGPLILDDSPVVTLAVLRAARGEVRNQAVGSRAIRRSPRLAWDALIELYGDETTLKERIEALKAAGLQGEDKNELLELADRYVTGWRPRDFDED